jgi:hypothetical protein
MNKAYKTLAFIFLPSCRETVPGTIDSFKIFVNKYANTGSFNYGMGRPTKDKNNRKKELLFLILK